MRITTEVQLDPWGRALGMRVKEYHSSAKGGMATGSRGRPAAGRDIRPSPPCIRVVLLLVAWAVQMHVWAQHDVHVLVLDSSTAEPLPGASVEVIDAHMATAADMNGTATLPRVPDGPLRLRVSTMGYDARVVNVTVPTTGTLRVRLHAHSEELATFTVSATRTNSRIDDAPQKIEVLGSEDLLEEGSLKPGNVLSLLGDISSVQVQQTSAVTGASVIRMQGLEGRHTLLLRDGMPAYGGLSGGFDLLRIPPLDLQRIEVSKGPSSTFNGGGAIAGAINIITKEPGDSLGGMVMLNRATLTETNANVYVSGPLGKVGFTLFGGANVQEPVDVNDDGYSDVPRLRGYQLHPQLFMNAGQATSVRIGLGYQGEDRMGGEMDALDLPFDSARYVDERFSERLAADLMMHLSFSSRSDLMVKASANDYFDQHWDNFSYREQQQTNQYAEAFWSQHTERHTWVAGASLTSSRLSGDSIHAQDLLTTGAFGQLALHRARWPEIDLGVRIDQNADHGVQLLPAAAAFFTLAEHVTLRANVGTGYQSPDRSLGYGPVPGDDIAEGVVTGTVPERSLGGTIEWTWHRAFGEKTSLFVDQTFFATTIADPLALAAASDGPLLLGNTDGSRFTRGVDNYVRLTHAGTELYLGYTFTLPEDVLDGHASTIPYTPLHRAATTLAHGFGEHWRAGLEASWSGAQEHGNGTRTPDQFFMAAMAGWHTGAWTFVLNGENITDTQQTGQRVFPPPSRPRFATPWAPIDGRVLNLSVLWKFGRG